MAQSFCSLLYSHSSNYYQILTEQHILTTEILQQYADDPNYELTEKEVETAINNLKKNKAPDQYGLVAEHLQKASSVTVPVLTKLLNGVIRCNYIPCDFKSSQIHVIGKKGKDLKLLDN